MFQQQGVQDPALMVLRGLDQLLMDFGEVSFGSNTAVVEQAVIKSIPMFIGKGLHGLISVKFQMLLVVISEH